MSDKNALIEDMAMVLRVALANIQPDALLTYKPMFGGAGFWVNGVIFAAWFGAGLALKLPENEREAFLAHPDTSTAMAPNYVEMSRTLWDNPEFLGVWVEKAVAYVLHPPKKKRNNNKAQPE
jgi:TfoX/Sxy family transcriptional regulator of competence genes